MKAALLTLSLCVVFVDVAPAADSLHFRLIGEWGGELPLSGLAVKGEYAYVGDGYTDGLSVVSVADPANPVEVGRCSLSSMPMDVTVSGDYAYVAAGILLVVSISDPLHPVVIARCSTQSNHKLYAAAVSGDYVVAGGEEGGGVTVFSVADPAHPVQVGHCGSLEWGVDHLEVSGDYVYVCTRTYGLRIVLVADPANPVEVGAYVPGTVTGVAVGDDYACVGCPGSLIMTSIADPANPVEIGRLDSTGLTPWGIALTRGYAFLAGGVSVGLWAVSVADSTHPSLAGYYGGKFGWYSLTADGDYVYYAGSGLKIYQFYQPGDLDIDNDSLDVAADTLRLHEWTTVSALSFRRSDEVATGGISAERPLDSAAGVSLGVTAGASFECVRGEFILANTSTSYNPDSIDGPSISPVDSLGVTGSLAGPGGTIDSLVIPNLPVSLAQGQTMVCTLAAYVPTDLKVGEYTGAIYISGKDTANLWVYESCFVRVEKLGDIDVDNDSLDVVTDTIRLTNLGSEVIGAFLLANTSASCNPDSVDGPSLSRTDSLSYTALLTGPGGALDSIIIRNFPSSLAQGQSAVCTLAVHLPERLPIGDYSGPVVITGFDSVHYEVAETVYALVKKGVPGDLDVDNDRLDVTRDTMDLHTQPAGPVYSPYAKARFMLVNTSSAYNPDRSDGPSESPLIELKVEASVEAQAGLLDSIYVLNMPASLVAGQSVECTLALVLIDRVAPEDYGGWVAVSATDTLGCEVRDSFFLTVRGPEPRQHLDSLRVAPIPFKPYQMGHDAIHFQGLTAGAKVTVYDASGLAIWTATETGDGHLAWDAKVASGIYAYLVVSADGKASKVGKLSVIR